LEGLVIKAWDNSTLALWNQEGSVTDCLYCRGSDSHFLNSIEIRSSFSLFDKEDKHLSLYYGKFFPRIIWNTFGRPRGVYLRLVRETLEYRHKLQFWRCQNCNIVFQNYPHESEFLNNHYSEYYRRAAGRTFGRPEDKAKEYQARQLIKKANINKSSMILDVGSAEGWFCFALARLGMKSFGIEPSEQMVRYAENVIKIKNITCSDYNKASYPDENFDVIHSFHSFEHILNLDETLQAMNFQLKPGGVLSISVPCADYIESADDHKRVFLFDHIYCFSEKWFDLNLPRYGFEIFDIQKNPFDAKKIKNLNICLNGDIPGGIWVLARKVKH
jgi:SAM-dependent methyltransferase